MTEHDSGYRAFMLQCAYYTLAHYEEMGDALDAFEQGQAHWQRYAEAGVDEAPVTDEYLAGWNEAQERMVRECKLATPPRIRTEMMRELLRKTYDGSPLGPTTEPQ